MLLIGLQIRLEYFSNYFCFDFQVLTDFFQSFFGGRRVRLGLGLGFKVIGLVLGMVSDFVKITKDGGI